MEMSDGMSAFVLSQIYRLPLLLIYVVAFVIALLRRDVLRERAVLAATGFGLLALGWLLTAGFMHWQMMQSYRGTDVTQLARFAAFSLPVAALAGIAGTVLVAIAALRREVKG